MRKTLFFTLLLTLLSAGTILYAAFDIYPLRDQVRVQELSEKDYGAESYGDASAAKGLTATLKTDYYEALCWETKIHFGASNPETDTSYHLQFPVQKSTSHTRDRKEIDLHTSAAGVLDGTTVLQELAEGLEYGQRREEKIYLKDYADYYTIDAMILFPETTWAWQAGDDSGADNETEAALQQLFDESFLFPLGSNVYVDAYGEEGEYGPAYGYSINTTSEGYYLNVKETFTGDSAYFTFNRKGESYWNLDVSHLPLGYGVYCLTVPQDGSRPTLTNVCPLNPDVKILKLTADPGGENVLVHTVEDETYVVTVIDTADNSVTQRLELTEFPSDSPAWATYEADGCTAVALGHKPETRQLILLTKDGSGQYQIHWNLTIPEKQSRVVSCSDNSDRDYYHDYWPVIAWNGQYLAFGLSDEYRDGFFISLYDENGLVYYGQYHTSLNIWPIGPDKDVPLTLVWE